MSRFLRVGMIADRLDDIVEAASLLLGEDTDPATVKSVADDIRTMALELKEFITRWDCEPLIYVGRGNTDQVIRMLDDLISKAENGAQGNGL